MLYYRLDTNFSSHFSFLKVHGRMDWSRRSGPGNSQRVSSALYNSFLSKHSEVGGSCYEKGRQFGTGTDHNGNFATFARLQQLGEGKNSSGILASGKCKVN